MLKSLISFVFATLEKIAPSVGARLGVWLFLKPFGRKLTPSEMRFEQDSRGFWLHVGERKVWVRSVGTGPEVIVAHGWSSHGLMLKTLIQALRDNDYCVIFPDFPAHGSSPGNSSNGFEFGETMSALLVRNPNTHALVGHSLGALGCIMALTQTPNKVEKFVSVAAPVKFDHVLLRFIQQVSAGKKTHDIMDKLLQVRFPQDKSEFSAIDLILKKPVNVSMLVVQDDSDPEVQVSDAREFARVAGADILITQSLGHIKIMHDYSTIEKIINFIEMT